MAGRIPLLILLHVHTCPHKLLQDGDNEVEGKLALSLIPSLPLSLYMYTHSLTHRSKLTYSVSLIVSLLLSNPPHSCTLANYRLFINGYDTLTSGDAIRPLQINFLFPVLETTNVVCGRAVNPIIYIVARPTGNT